jgi:hypothetical protein
VERTGLSPEVLLAFWVPEVATALRGAENWIQALEADPHLRQEFRAGLDRVWTLGDQ